MPDPRIATSGGKFSSANAKSEVEWKIYHAQRLPAPGQYEVLKLAEPLGGRISTAQVRTSLDWEIFRAKNIPGPGALPRSVGANPTMCALLAQQAERRQVT